LGSQIAPDKSPQQEKDGQYGAQPDKEKEEQEIEFAGKPQCLNKPHIDKKGNDR